MINKSNTIMALGVSLALAVPFAGWAQNSSSFCVTNKGNTTCGFQLAQSNLSLQGPMTPELKRLRAAVLTARAVVAQAEGDQIEDHRDVLARAALRRIEAKFLRARERHARGLSGTNNDQTAAISAAELEARRKHEQMIAEQARLEEVRRQQRENTRRIVAIGSPDWGFEAKKWTVGSWQARAADQEFAQAGFDRQQNTLDFATRLSERLGPLWEGAQLANGDQVVTSTGDRVVVQRFGALKILKNDDILLHRAGNQLVEQTYEDGSVLTQLTYPFGPKITSKRGVDGEVYHRVRPTPSGKNVLLFNESQPERRMGEFDLSRERSAGLVSSAAPFQKLELVLGGTRAERLNKPFSLRQVREIPRVRALVPEIVVDGVTFAPGSAAIQPNQIRLLATLARAVKKEIWENKRTVILIEGHADSEGDKVRNLILSDRRAETIALTLVDYFDVRAENLIVQGYGISARAAGGDQRLPGTRVSLRNITSLLRQ